MHVKILSAFLLYFSILFLIGLISRHRMKTATDFITGDRSLNYWLTAFSAQASDMSAWMFMAFPSAMYLKGFPYIWTALGLLLGMFFNWQLVAKRLRLATAKLDSCTLSTFFERRFEDKSGILRIATALIALFFLSCYLTAGLIAMGYLLESVFFIDYYLGLSIALLAIVTYTSMGGFVTVAWVDLFQALFLLAVVIFVPLYALGSLDAPIDQILSVAAERQLPMHLYLGDTWFDSLIIVVMLILSWGLGYFGQPHIITKYMGIRDPEEIYKSKWVGMTWMVFAISFSALLGIVAIGFFPSGLANPELLFFEMVRSLFPAFLAGFIICAFIGANISTMDSQILVCSSIVSEDFYKYITKKPPSECELLFASRAAVIGISLIALSIAFLKSSTVMETVKYAWFGLGCSFGPLVLMSLHSKTANRNGAIAGIFVGGGLAATWPLINPLLTSFSIPSMIPGFFCSLITIYVVSRITANKK